MIVQEESGSKRYSIENPCCDSMSKFVEAFNSDLQAPYLDFKSMEYTDEMGVFNGLKVSFCMFCGANISKREFRKAA